MNDLDKSKVIDDDYVLSQYNNKINYYWAASRSNKNAYKSYRTWTIILGSLVTLISSVSAAELIQVPVVKLTLSIMTPILAASLTMVSGLGQNFRWGSTWRDMLIGATRLERERDRFLATSPDKRNLEKELDILNSIVLEETREFFQRILDNEVKPNGRIEQQG